LHVPATADFVAHAYLVDLPLLRFMAASRVLSVRLPQEPLASPYALWRDGRAALGRFVRRPRGPDCLLSPAIPEATRLAT